ncbi:MAG: enoyl-CoA hydratase-related protein [Acetobacteraceae bacterium]
MSELPSYETLALDQPAEHVLRVRLDRPAFSNAMNTQMGRDILSLFLLIGTTPNRYRCVILTGTGERAFCAGGDLKERQGMTDAAWQDQHLIFEQAVRALQACPVPVIGAINGAAYGGGCELTLCCDFAYGAETARFALTEVTLGIMPGAGGTQSLPRAVGERRAKEIILTGRPFTAAQAQEWGMLNGVCPPGALQQTVLDVATTIANNAPIATRQIKQSIHFGLQMDAHTGYMFEIEAYNRLVPTADRREGVAAFNEKRKPRFTGS